MSANPFSPVFAAILASMFGCMALYGSILREVNQGRNPSERIGFSERAKFLEVLALHSREFPSSKKRVVLWFLAGVFPLGLAAVVAIQYFRPN